MVKMCSDRYISQWLLRKVRECVMLQHVNFRDIRVDFSFNINTYAKPIIHPCNHHCNEEGNTLVAWSWREESKVVCLCHLLTQATSRTFHPLSRQPLGDIQPSIARCDVLGALSKAVSTWWGQRFTLQIALWECRQSPHTCMTRRTISHRNSLQSRRKRAGSGETWCTSCRNSFCRESNGVELAVHWEVAHGWVWNERVVAPSHRVTMRSTLHMQANRLHNGCTHRDVLVCHTKGWEAMCARDHTHEMWQLFRVWPDRSRDCAVLSQSLVSLHGQWSQETNLSNSRRPSLDIGGVRCEVMTQIVNDVVWSSVHTFQHVSRRVLLRWTSLLFSLLYHSVLRLPERWRRVWGRYLS